MNKNALAVAVSGVLAAGGAGITAGGSTTAASSAAALTHGATFNEFDAFSRYDRICYDSSALGRDAHAITNSTRLRLEISRPSLEPEGPLSPCVNCR